MAVVKSIGELDAKEYNALNATLMQSGYCVVENGDEVNLVSLSDLTNFMGHYKEYSQLETSNKELIAAINELYAYVYNYVWIGTTEEYEALETYEDMFYLVTDGGANFDPVLDNTVEEIETDIEVLKSRKLQNCHNLTRFYAPHIKTIESYALFGCENLSILTLSNNAIGDNETLTLNEYCLANNTGAIISSDSILRWIDVDEYHYGGMVDTAPTSTTTITVTDEVVYGSTTPTRTLDVVEGLIVIDSVTAWPYVFKNGEWIDYIPEKSVILGNTVFHSTRIRDIGFKVAGKVNSNDQPVYKSRVLFTIMDKNYTTPMNWQYSNIMGVFVETPNGTLSDELPYTTLGEAFYQCANLHSIKVPNLETIEGGTFRDTGLFTLNLPKLTTFGRNSTYQGCCGSRSLTTVTMGNGTSTLSWLGKGHFNDCVTLYSLTLNYTAVPDLPNGNMTASTNEFFNNCPIFQFKGTTTTQIVEGATAGNVVIDGVTISTANGYIVSYDGEDYQRVSGKWQKWGNAQDKHPRILVPSSLIDTYKAHSKWGTLSPEIWQAI